MTTHQRSSAKKIGRTYIACWNVKSLGNPTKFNVRLKNVIETMRKKNLSLLAMSEVQWLGSGILEVDNTTVLFSGLDEKKAGNQRGVAIALRGDLRAAWKNGGTHSLISERIMQIRIKTRYNHLNVIAVYAPTEVDDETESENFYESLQNQFDKANKKDFIVVLGDFNARVGPLNPPSRLHGLHNPDVRNRNGTRLVDFCNSNGLIITNTIFPHKKIHQFTWHHPSQKGGHVLDYVLINHPFRAGIYDTKVSRNTIHTSDHNLVISKIVLNKNKTYTKTKTFNNSINKLHTKITNPTKLNTENINTFKEILARDLINRDNHETIEQTWKRFKECLVNASISSLPNKNKAIEKQWINDEVRTLCKEKSKCHLEIKSLRTNGQTIPQELSNRYNQAKVQTKKACRKAIDSWWEKKAEEAETTTQLSIKQGRGGSILKILKLAKTSKIKTSVNLKSEDGVTTISSLDGKLERWRSHFEAASNPDTKLDFRIVEELTPLIYELNEEDSQKLVEPFSIEEIVQALKKCKLETASGIDNINSNLLKLGAEITASWLKVIFDEILTTETIPKDWNRQIIIPIHKKGSKSLCQNYRGISLLSEASKVFGRVLLNRVQGTVEKQLGDNQCGFRPNRGCCDQLFSIRMLMQRAKEFNKPIFLCFIDLQRAYDTVDRRTLWEILAKSFGFPRKIIRIIEALHSNTTGVVRSDGLMSEDFPINVGVKQGDVLAPILFNMFLDAVIRVALKNFPNEGIQLNYSYNAPLIYNTRHKLDQEINVQNLAYADDIVLTSSSIVSLQRLLDSMYNTITKFGLKINPIKTKYMSITPDKKSNTNDAISNDDSNNNFEEYINYNNFSHNNNILALNNNNNLSHNNNNLSPNNNIPSHNNNNAGSSKIIIMPRPNLDKQNNDAVQYKNKSNSNAKNFNDNVQHSPPEWITFTQYRPTQKFPQSNDIEIKPQTEFPPSHNNISETTNNNAPQTTLSLLHNNDNKTGVNINSNSNVNNILDKIQYGNKKNNITESSKINTRLRSIFVKNKDEKHKTHHNDNNVDNVENSNDDNQQTNSRQPSEHFEKSKDKKPNKSYIKNFPNNNSSNNYQHNNNNVCASRMFSILDRKPTHLMENFDKSNTNNNMNNKKDNFHLNRTFDVPACSPERSLTPSRKNDDNDNRNNKSSSNNKRSPSIYTTTLSIENNANLEKVSQFKYLGSILSSDNTVDAEVEARTNKAAQAFRSLSRLIWYQPKIKVQTKLKLFKAVIIPTLLYGSETWNLLQHHIQRLQVFVNRCLRIITGTSLWNKIRNTELRNSAKIERVEVMICKRRLQWLGHVARMSDERLPKKLLVCQIENGKRKQGGQKQRWHDLVHADLKKLKMVETWRIEAKDRKKWRAKTYDLLHELNNKKELEEKSKKDFIRLQKDMNNNTSYNTNNNINNTPNNNPLNTENNNNDISANINNNNSDNTNNNTSDNNNTRDQNLFCTYPGCNKKAVNRAGLANHIRQRHGEQVSIQCQHCGLSFKRQGFYNHNKKCSSSNPSVHLPHGG